MVHGLDWANAYAGWVGAVVAAGYLKMSPRIGISACFYILDPSAINSQRDFVLTLASCRTGVATNALAIINDKAIILRRGRGIYHLC